MVHSLIKITCFFIFIYSTLLSAQADDMIENISLNGKWAIIFDQDNRGGLEKWHLKQEYEKQKEVSDIQVPSHWETIKKDYEGVVFYKKSFRVPESWNEGVFSLHFEAVNYKTEVWVNDQAVGTHEGGFTPFSFQVDEVLKPGEINHIIMRVVGPILMTDQRIDEMGRMEVPQWRGAITGGIWQDVWIQRRGNITIHDVFLQPDIDKSQTGIDLELYNHQSVQQKTTLSIEVNDAAGNMVGVFEKNMELDPGKNSLKTAIDIPNQKLWSPKSPHLYSIDISLTNGKETTDNWTHRFGMRKFTIKNNQFYLNNEPLYLKATFFEGLYPVGLAYPDSKEMAIREIQLAKEL